MNLEKAVPGNAVPAAARLAGLAGMGAMLVLIGASLARAFGAGSDGLALCIAAALGVLIAAGFGKVPPRLRTTCLVLALCGAAVWPFAPEPLPALRRGLFVGGTLVTLTASVMLIAHCAMRDPHIKRLGESLRELHGVQRFLAFTLAGQFLSGMLGLAGANLMFIMAAPHAGEEPPSAERTDTIVAVCRGFSAASCWSPVFGQMAVLLALYPGLHWGQVFPVGVVFGQIAVSVSLLLAWRSVRAGGARKHGGRSGWNAVLKRAGPVAVVLLAVLGMIVALSAGLHIVVSAAITLTAPVVAWLFFALTGTPGRRVADGWRGLGSGMQRFSALSSEACLFLAAGCAGSLMAAAFPHAWVAAIGAKLSIAPVAGLAFLLLSILTIALAGIHPVLTAVFLASTFTPQALGLPPLAHMAAVLAGWALSNSVTPFSVLTLTASRYAGLPSSVISMGRNWVFAALNGVIIILLLSVYCVVLNP
jgi:hypothetical protein